MKHLCLCDEGASMESSEAPDLSRAQVLGEQRTVHNMMKLAGHIEEFVSLLCQEILCDHGINLSHLESSPFERFSGSSRQCNFMSIIAQNIFHVDIQLQHETNLPMQR